MREELGLDYLACLARASGLDTFASRIVVLWNEYEERKTVVSQVVHQVDKFQALTQAYLYSRRYPKLTQLADFRSLRASLRDPWLAQQADDILSKWDEADSRQTSGMVFILVVGGPGVGKGTQCDLGSGMSRSATCCGASGIGLARCTGTSSTRVSASTCRCRPHSR